MLYDGKSKAGASGLPGSALIHPIEALEDTVLMFFRDTDAVIFHDQVRMTFMSVRCNLYFASFFVVTALYHVQNNSSDVLNRGGY